MFTGVPVGICTPFNGITRKPPCCPYLIVGKERYFAWLSPSQKERAAFPISEIPPSVKVDVDNACMPAAAVDLSIYPWSGIAR